MLSGIRRWYARFERPLSSVSLVGGFVFDALTLKRVDMLWENFWVVVHLLAVAVCIFLVDMQEEGAVDARDPERTHFWLINILQFVFGGLLSTFLVFYFRSGTLAASWPFLLLLAIAFIANESLKKHYARLDFQLSLFFLSLYAFAIFILPVILHRIGTVVFLLSGAASLALFGFFLFLLARFARERFTRGRNRLFFAVGGIFAAINLLYFFNLIPPLPLSLKDGGIYFSVARNANGTYSVGTEAADGLGFLDWTQDVHAASGQTLYAYSAIFSPTALDADIVHEWQRYDDGARAWVTVSRIDLGVSGGREGGYRTYSLKRGVTPGSWRVNIETPKGQVIGRLRFDVIPTDGAPALTTEVKD